MNRYKTSIHGHEEVVTDLCGNLLQKDGKPFHLKIANEDFITPGLSLDQLARMAANSDKRVIVVASGHAKTEALTSILKGKYANMIIIDEQLGESLMNN